MSHEIENNEAFYVGKPAWHGLGTVLTDAPKDAREAAKIAFPGTVHKVPLFAQIGEATAPAPGSFGVYRSNGAYLGHVGTGYEVLQPEEHFEAFQPYIDAGIIDLETGMALQGGKRLAILAKLKGADADILPGDQVKGYWLLYSSFDGSLALGCKGTGVRVVCANTLAMSLQEKNGKGSHIKMKHTRNVREKLADAQETLARELAGFQSDVARMQVLARKQVSRKIQEQYLCSLFTDAKTEAEMSEVPTVTINKINHVIELLDTQRGLEFVPAARGTMWQAYNAMSEYLTHEAGRTEDTRVNSQFFGQSAKANTIAFDRALALC